MNQTDQNNHNAQNVVPSAKSLSQDGEGRSIDT